MHPVFLYDEFNDHDLGDGESPLRKKFNAIIEDLEENKSTNQGDIKLIRGKGGIKYFRAKLSDRDRLLFKAMKHGDKDIFVILEVILNHDYRRSKFLTDEKKIENIKIIDQNSKEVSDSTGEVKIRDAPQVCWLGKFITFSAKQEDIVENAKGKCNLPLVVSGSAGSGKTSVALEKLRKIEEEFKEGKILYITQSKGLIEKSKELYEYEYYDEAANELRTGVSQRIEFLSVHEFIERVTKEDRKRVEGKRPINRNAFFSWFNEECKKGKLKKYKKDGEKIFEEFTAVIAGGGLLGKDQYVNLGDRQSIFPEDERCSIYDFFEEYKKFIEGSSEYYDTSLIAHECVEKVQANYDAVVVDEVQDLTKSTLKLILKSLKDDYKNDFLLCGDVNQVIHPSFFSISRLKSFLHEDGGHNKGGLQVCTLEKNYRNSKQVIEFANRILHLKNYCFASEDKMTEGEKKAFFMKSGTENPGNVGFIAKGDEQKIAGKISESTNWAVLVLDDESKEDARKLFKTPLVFSIQEAKGLEFGNVILYKFTSDKAYNKIWSVACPGKGKEEIGSTIDKIRRSYEAKGVNPSRPKNKEDKSFEEHKFYMNALYVAVTRAINNVYIIDDEKKCNLLRVIEPGERGNVSIENTKKEESSPEEWKDMALKLIDEGNIEQAEKIKEKLLCKGEKKYAKEIMDALKAKECHVEVQDSDKDKQAISKLKTENPTPQKSSMGESRTSIGKARRCKGKKLQDEKHEQNTNPKEKNTEELFSALKNGNLQEAENLIMQGVNVNAKNYKDDDTPLHVAAYNGYESIARLLLEHGANVNVTSKYGSTPLHLAALRGYKGVVQLLLRKRANVDVTMSNDFTPLHLVAEKGNENVVELLLKKGANVNAKAKKGCTPLHLAAQEGYKNVAQLLLEKGATVDVTMSDGCTPLHLAAQEGYKNIAQLLLKNGANVDATTSDGSTPLYVAVQKGRKNVAQLLLKKGANVDAKDEGGWTPLHVAVYNDRDSVVELLLKNGANVDAKSKGGYTPLHLAAEKGNENVVELLLKKGANVNAKAKKGCTPLSLALKSGYSEIVDLLLADPNINVGCIEVKSVSYEKEEDKRKFTQKRAQDSELFNKVKEAAEKVKGGGELGDSLKKELGDLLKPESKYSFKLSLNYSPDSTDENTTLKIAIKAGGEVLQLLYTYAEKNIGVDTETFKQLKHAKEQENSQPKSDVSNVSVSGNLTQAQDSKLEGYNCLIS